VTTTARAVRIPDDLWTTAIRVAEQRGTTVTAVVIAALEEFIAHDDDPTPPPNQGAPS
jgi:hypothetical protein